MQPAPNSAFVTTAVMRTQLKCAETAVSSLNISPTKPSSSVPTRVAPTKRAKTSPADHALPDYMSDIGEYCLLSTQQERQLLANIRTLQTHEAAEKTLASHLGRAATAAEIAQHLNISKATYVSQRATCLTARNDLVAHNLRLVVKIARNVYRTSSGTTAAIRRMDISGVSLSDLIQEGSLGLIRAAERFDMTRDRQFSTYACRAIWSHCRRAAMPASCIVSIPDRLKLAAGRLRRFRGEYERTHGATPDDGLQADVTAREDLQLVRTCERHLNGGVFLDAPIARDQSVSILDTLVSAAKLPEDVVDERLVCARLIRACLRQLSTRDANIVILKFGIDCAPVKGAEIARMFGISQARVAQIVAQALIKLKRNEPDLADYLDAV